MIERIVVMNLEKRIDKLYFVMGALRVAGFPVNTCRTRFGKILKICGCLGVDLGGDTP